MAHARGARGARASRRARASSARGERFFFWGGQLPNPEYVRTTALTPQEAVVSRPFVGERDCKLRRSRAGLRKDSRITAKRCPAPPVTFARPHCRAPTRCVHLPTRSRRRRRPATAYPHAASTYPHARYRLPARRRAPATAEPPAAVGLLPPTHTPATAYPTPPPTRCA